MGGVAAAATVERAKSVLQDKYLVKREARVQYFLRLYLQCFSDNRSAAARYFPGEVGCRCGPLYGCDE